MLKKSLLALTLVGASLASFAAPQAEYLNRGLFAMNTGNGVFVSWRCLDSDSRSMTFDLYRDGVKVNEDPITAGTNFTDPAGKAGSKYVLKAYENGAEVEVTPEVAAEADVYRRLHLDRPAGGTIKGNSSFSDSKHTVTDDYTYTPNDCSVGDVDGDGEYEIFVKWDPSNSQDNSFYAYTGNVYIDCYKLDGTKLWRIDLGQNIRAGAHYTQFMVYDFDGDGKAEMICKTAPGTKDGQGKNVIMGSDDPNKSYADSKGVIKDGPEYLTVFNGLTGAEIHTVAYEPSRSVHAQSSSGWGDSYGNRSERYLACVAYLDGQKPSVVMCRGYYTHAYLVAWDFDGKQLKKRWTHASTSKGKGAYGEGAHSLTVGDVDGDGCDEIVFGSACIDHDGNLLYRTGFGHGDALHLGDFDPDRDGLEVFMVHEETGASYKYDSEFRDAKTGQVIWGTAQSGNDIGRGLVGNISDRWRGYEVWPGSYYVGGTNVNGTFDCKGNLLINKRFDCNFRIYWDGDLLDELFDGKYNSSTGLCAPVVTKMNPTLSGSSTLIAFNKWNAQTCNTTKATPCLQADILGDWREEVIMWDGNNSSDLLIFSTTIPSRYRVPCLMQDHNYRMAIAWQNTAYNQPPHLGYYLADLFETDPQVRLQNGQTTQVVELGSAMAPLTGSWANCDGVTATGLPNGVELKVDTENVKWELSGTPTEIGDFNYVISTVGGEPVGTLEGLLKVQAPVVLEKMAHFKFEEATTTQKNEVYGEAKTRVSSTTMPELVEGIVGNAVNLPHYSHYFVQSPYEQLTFGADDFTVEFWFASTGSACYFFHKGSLGYNEASGRSGSWVGLELKDGNFKFAIDGGDDHPTDPGVKSEATAPGSDYMDGNWHYVVLVREGATKSLKIYVDGNNVGEASDGTGALRNDIDDLVVGNVNLNFDSRFNGKLDEFIIWKGAMSASKILENYKAGVEAGITDVEYTPIETAKLTLVDAISGVVVARGIGNIENVTAQAKPGVYILLIEKGKLRETHKFVKK
ncbi:MAG: Por secretion system protein [Muribaculaceae bacterium]|nr:Por secretion system protein [Muribaculaceae bacterium]